MDSKVQNDTNKNINGVTAENIASQKPVPIRRSSVVVIPPMQVCPGDLLVYSKALTHRDIYTGMCLLRVYYPFPIIHESPTIKIIYYGSR